MHIIFSVRWCCGGISSPEIDQGLFQLLTAIQTEGSLVGAARSSRMSYRHAWGMLRRWEEAFGTPLVRLERGRGRGANLTDLGAKLIQEKQYVDDRITPILDACAAEVNNSLAGHIKSIAKPVLRVYASHGMAISYLNEQLQQDARFVTEFQTHGSLDNLKYLNNNQCQVAGFHIPLQLVDKILAPQYKHWLSPKRHLLMKVATREQGLIVRRGNPKKINTLADLGKRSVRFINRQRNSGTRTILDQLLLREGINPATISGYPNEEFTHLAVAAMVASGAADAGFGIKAVTEQFALDFIPCLQEAYVLAIDNTVADQIREAMEKLLTSAAMRRRINKLPGYNARGSGKYVSFSQLFGNDGE